MTALQRAFPQTHWSQIFRAGRLSDPEALSKLCATYFQPIHAFFLSLGCSREDASDAAQSFFEALLQGKVIGDVDRERGRFRAFLRTAARNHLYNGRKGKNPRIGANWSLHASFDASDCLPIDDLEESTGPDVLFDRHWARAVVDIAWSRLKLQYDGDKHQRLADLILGDCDDAPSDAELCVELATSPGALRTRRSRSRKDLKRRFAHYLREEVARTVSSRSVIDDELRYLLEVLT